MFPVPQGDCLIVENFKANRVPDDHVFKLFWFEPEVQRRKPMPAKELWTSMKNASFPQNEFFAEKRKGNCALLFNNTSRW
jgi:hypothetical protein